MDFIDAPVGYDRPLFVYLGRRSVDVRRVVGRYFNRVSLPAGWIARPGSAPNRFGRRRDAGPLRVGDAALRELQGRIFGFGAINFFGSRVLQSASADTGIFLSDLHIDCDGAFPPEKAARGMDVAAFVP